MTDVFTEEMLYAGLDAIMSSHETFPVDVFTSESWKAHEREVQKWEVTLFSPKGLSILFPALNHGR